MTKLVELLEAIEPWPPDDARTRKPKRYLVNPAAVSVMFAFRFYATDEDACTELRIDGLTLFVQGNPRANAERLGLDVDRVT